MKKLVLFSICFCLVAAFALPAMAADFYPRKEGNDVLVPDVLIKQIPGFDPAKPVYSAHDINGWFVRGDWGRQHTEDSEMKQEGGVWRAKSLAGQRFHPVQLDDEGKPIWAKIENVYPLDSDFVDNSGPGPCLLLK